MIAYKVGIVDYGIGNIKSVVNSLNMNGCDSIVSNNPNDFKNIKKIFLVGVGSFNVGVKNIIKLGFNDYLTEHLEKGGQIFGICLGMQILFTVGYENIKTKGLNFVKGSVESIKMKSKLRVPHIGWNNLNKNNFSKLSILKDVDIRSNFYFIHSFYASVEDNIPSVTTSYEHLDICSVFEKNDNIFGVQFHPEKSQKPGMLIINNFLKL